MHPKIVHTRGVIPDAAGTLTGSMSARRNQGRQRQGFATDVAFSVGVIAAFNFLLVGSLNLLDLGPDDTAFVSIVFGFALASVIGLPLFIIYMRLENRDAKPKIAKTVRASTAVPPALPELIEGQAMIDPVPEPSTPVICISNQKGGVGKTTTAINLATALGERDQRVLVIDLDPQGNASTGLGLAMADRRLSSYQLLIGQCQLSDAVVETEVPGVSLVPSTMDLAGAEIELADMDRRAWRLRDALTKGLGAFDFDYILIDCPPALGLLTINAMTASTSMIVPLQCEFFALEGLAILLKSISRVKESFNPNLQIRGILLTMYDKRNNLSALVAEDVRGFMGDKVYRTVIPRNVQVAEAPSFGMPALIYDHRCKGSQAYIELAGELLAKVPARVAA